MLLEIQRKRGEKKSLRKEEGTSEHQVLVGCLSFISKKVFVGWRESKEIACNTTCV